MTDELLAYLLDDLSLERRAEVEEKLATDFAWQREKQRLEECLAACGDPCKCADEPPQDLVVKTCFLVEHSDDRPQPAQRKHHCGAAAAFTAESPCLGGASRPWSLVDLAVGGGVLMLVGLLVTPAIFDSRAASRRSMCQNNLRAFGTALFNYQENRNHRLPQVGPKENAGRYALELLDAGVLSREELQQMLVCPESPLAADIAAGRVSLVLPSREALESATGQELAAWLKSMGGSYAYRLGYYDENGRYRQAPFTGEARSPMMADAPNLSPSGIRIVNHAGGQHVLDQSLSAPFRTNFFNARRDNIYLNEDEQHAAGRGPKDVTLLRSEYGRDGLLTPVNE
jgi:hypothetical protein